jgi:hypothetical protein
MIFDVVRVCEPSVGRLDTLRERRRWSRLRSLSLVKVLRCVGESRLVTSCNLNLNLLSEIVQNLLRAKKKNNMFISLYFKQVTATAVSKEQCTCYQRSIIDVQYIYKEIPSCMLI